MRSLSKTTTISTILWVALILVIGQIVVDRVVANLLLSQFDAALESKDRPRAILQVSREREKLDHTILRFHFLIAGISIVVVIVVALSVTRAIRRGLEPLIQITNEISQISPQTLDRRLTTEAQPRELKPIATQFNLVLSEIENALTRERKFSSDVAHELRTPVSEIRSLAEVGLRWPDEKDVRSYFVDIHESSRQLDLLIENLLQLCRSEEGSIELEIIALPLDKLLEKVCLNLAIESREKDIDIALPEMELPRILADSQWFELILQNLVFNALSHSPRGASVILKAELDSDYCSLLIENPMMNPLSTQDLDLIFKRFWRKDSARESGSHNGIGLSLVKSYADLMDLEVSASIAGDMFRIQLSNIKIT